MRTQRTNADGRQRTLVARARLALLERLVLPFPHASLLEPFTDLLADAALDRSLLAPMGRVPGAVRPASALACFLRAVREEMGQTTSGELFGAAQDDFERSYPGGRAEARRLVEDLRARASNVFAQFLCFLGVVSRYLPLPDKAPAPTSASCSLSPTAWACALTPGKEERAALEDARKAGWISASLTHRLSGPEGLSQRILALPGADSDDATLIPEVMAIYYRRQARRHLLRRMPRTSGGGERVRGGPRLEIYLDVSGSLPDPRFQRNPLTLAAQVLLTAALRAGGAARLALYSNVPVCSWQWCRSEAELSRFLMHYVGSGTCFPFELLEESIAECGEDQPVRVILGDADFDRDHDRSPDHAEVLRATAAASPGLVMFLHGADLDHLARYRRTGARVLSAEEGEDYPRLAAALAGALLGEGAHVSL